MVILAPCTGISTHDRKIQRIEKYKMENNPLLKPIDETTLPVIFPYFSGKIKQNLNTTPNQSICNQLTEMERKAVLWDEL